MTKTSISITLKIRISELAISQNKLQTLLRINSYYLISLKQLFLEILVLITIYLQVSVKKINLKNILSFHQNMLLHIPICRMTLINMK